MDAWHDQAMRSRLKGKARALDIIEIPEEERLKNPAIAAGTVMNGQKLSPAYQNLQNSHKSILGRLPLQQGGQGNGVMHEENIIDLENPVHKRLAAPIVIDPDGQGIRELLSPPVIPKKNERILGENLGNYVAHNEAKRQKNSHPPPAQMPVAQFGELWLDNPYQDALAPFEEAGLLAGGNIEQFLEDGFPDAFEQEVDEANLGAENKTTSINEEILSAQVKSQVIGQVEIVLPGICWDYVSDLWDKSASKTAEALIEVILEKGSYPKAKDAEKALKRKRVVDPDEEAAKNYKSADRPVSNSLELMKLMRSLLSHEFPATPMTYISATLKESGYRLFSTYQALEEADRLYDLNNPPYIKIKRSRKADPQLCDNELDRWINIPGIEAQIRETLVEFRLARKLKRKAEAEQREKKEAQLAEEANASEAAVRGEMGECGCCFGDFPLNRMIHCDSDTILHWFCRGCAKQNADTVIGQSKYELRCMSMDDCSAGFDMEQRSKFLDENTVIALDRNEQEAVLRLAGIENLASCPFCPYAAEYPPVEIDKEFRCQAPDCEKVSCRLCKLESHIPLSCEEFAKENGLSIRRQIEEAMSAALIRKCNKCGTPFIKEEGCNKMTCTRNGCYNMQCYVCHKSCSYDHFNDTSRGGKPGNCPLFENVEDRHKSEVTKAEKEAMRKVRKAHPEYSEEDLKIHLSARVRKDEEARRVRHGNNAHAQQVQQARNQARFLRQAQEQARILQQQRQAHRQQMEQEYHALRQQVAQLDPAGVINKPNNLANHELPQRMPALPQWQAPWFKLQQLQPANFQPPARPPARHPPAQPIQRYQRTPEAQQTVNPRDLMNLGERFFNALGREQPKPPIHGLQGFQAMQQGYKG